MISCSIISLLLYRNDLTAIILMVIDYVIPNNCGIFGKLHSLPFILETLIFLLACYKIIILCDMILSALSYTILRDYEYFIINLPILFTFQHILRLLRAVPYDRKPNGFQSWPEHGGHIWNDVHITWVRPVDGSHHYSRHRDDSAKHVRVDVLLVCESQCFVARQSRHDRGNCGRVLLARHASVCDFWVPDKAIKSVRRDNTHGELGEYLLVCFECCKQDVLR